MGILIELTELKCDFFKNQTIQENTMTDVFKRNQLKFLPNQQVSPASLYTVFSTKNSDFWVWIQ